MKFPILECGPFAVCYDDVPIRYFNSWEMAEEYLYLVYESRGMKHYYIKRIV